MLNILLMIILIIILIILIILILGIKIILKFEKKDSEIKGCLKILILKYIKVYSTDLSRDDDEKDEDKKDKAPKDGKKLFKLIKPCLSDLKSYLKKVLDTIKFNKFETHLVLGFSNFAKTGEYIGYVWAILSVLNTIIPNSQLTANPSFTESKLDLKGNIEIEIRVIALIIPTIQLLLKPEIRALIKGVRNG